MDDLWVWVSLTETVLAYGVGVAMLVRHRRRSRQATTMALVALAALAADGIFGGMLMAAVMDWARNVGDRNGFAVMNALWALRQFVRVGAVLVLVWAVIIDREPPAARPQNPPRPQNLT